MRVLVNAGQWLAADASERDSITLGLIASGSLKEGDEIVPDEDTIPFDLNKNLQLLWNPIGDLCRVACDTAAGSAFAWCTANTSGVALAACMAAAEAARQECRNRC